MNKQEISMLINQIYASNESELVCSQMHELLPVYVEAEFEGEALTATVTRDIQTHLHHCPDCTELYQGIYFLVKQEAVGELHLEEPAHPAIPPQRKPGALTPVAGS